jgi:hypothetical protein
MVDDTRTASGRQGTVATVAVGGAAVISVLAALTARRLWLGRETVEFFQLAPIVLLAWVVAGVLFLRWLRAAGHPTTGLVKGWVAASVVALGTSVFFLAFMDFGRPTYRSGSYSDVVAFVVAVIVTAALATGLAVALRRRPPR